MPTPNQPRFLPPPPFPTPAVTAPRQFAPSLLLSSALVAMSGFVAGRDSVATVAPKRVALEVRS